MPEESFENGQAGVEVSPEMIEAGVGILEGQFPDGLSQGFAEDLARDVFVAMFSQWPCGYPCSD